MKKLALLLIIFLFVFCTACNKLSLFDQYMLDGRDALKAGDYSKAQKSFDNALIERPNDKDAKTLYDRSTEELENSIKIEESKKLATSIPENEKEVYQLIKTTLDNFLSDIDNFVKNIDVNNQAIMQIDINTFALLSASEIGKEDNVNAIILSFIASKLKDSYNSVIQDPNSKYAKVRVEVHLNSAKDVLNSYEARKLKK